MAADTHSIKAKAIDPVRKITNLHIEKRIEEKTKTYANNQKKQKKILGWILKYANGQNS
jgi:pantothenate kinase type III